MKLVIALLAAVGAVTAAVIFRRKLQAGASAAWNETTDSVSSWSRTAAEKAGEATGEVTATAQKAATVVSDSAGKAEGAVSG